MTDHAQTAVENAFRLEGKKDRLAQRQSGDWTITFTVQASDMPHGLLSAPMGTRYVIAAVEVADDETPVEQPDRPAAECAAAQPEADAIAAEARGADPHHYSRQAALWCKKEPFWKFLYQERTNYWSLVETCGNAEEAAAGAVREICQVESRAELDTDAAAAKRWRGLMLAFDEWRGVA